MAIVNLDSSYYAYGLFKFLKTSGYKPVDIKDIDTLFHLKNRESVIAIGYPNESVFKTKNQKELPTKFALFTSPIFTIPIVTNGTVYDDGAKTDSFEINIFTYHGFSGCPIINYKGKLVGITHGYTSPKKTNSKGNYYEYHGEFKKTTLLMPLLRDLLRQIQSQQMQLEHF
ncbi:trypsin-like peptidase domain-containing protein, partial [Hydrotalea sp.]|uniref:trypsin-like peptidase domain-containing protein n=1 Tax=Hydrotalea sp. TaxID=2881279 RepID=UPI00262FA8AE